MQQFCKDFAGAPPKSLSSLDDRGPNPPPTVFVSSERHDGRLNFVLTFPALPAISTTMNPRLRRFAFSAGLIPSLALAAEFKLGPHNFTVPDGFEVEVAAGSPLVDRPISADFDEQGRLYVSDSSGFSERSDKQIELKPHRIVRLEDTDGDGRFDKSIVFADKMMFPEGVLWHDGSLYVAAPPSIWKLTDTDGDGVADKREEWHQGKTITGCMNDLHGPFLGLDG